MTCSELENVLCDYLDGVLAAGERQEVETHLAGCPACAEFAADVRLAVRFFERAAPVEPPQALVTHLLYQIPGQLREVHPPRGRLARWCRSLFEPVFQPRLVMGMAMTVLSFAMLGRFAGIQIRQLHPSDLDPVKIIASVEDRIHRTWVRAVKYYQSLRLVYEIQFRLRELTDSEQEAETNQDAGRPSEDPTDRQPRSITK
ncbi:MAG: zf-HC2 domain-containing protein [Bryobacteraceae bacterium]|nr:zf-HC2 domain-containing protein [Bryobacteraceae bacterium]MDW8377338.1 zf-HC2 domain-containing protein [Bryobacterales bacterium]